MSAGDAGHRLRTVHQRPAGTAGRAAGTGGQPASAVLGFRRAARRGHSGPPAERLRRPAEPLGLPEGAPTGPVRERLPPALPRGVPALPADSRVAGPARAAEGDLPRARARPQRCRRRTRAGAHRGIGRPALPRGSGRPARGAEERLPARAPPGRAAGVSGCPGSPVRDQSGVQCRQGPATAGDGGGDRGDHPAVGSYGRRDQVRAGRGGRRAPVEAVLQRAALVRPVGGGDGLRAGEPLRRTDHRPPAGRVRRDRRGRGAGDLRPRGPGRGPVANPTPLLPGQPARARRGRGVGGADPAPRPARRRRDHLRLLRRPRAGGDHLGGALRRLVEVRTARDARPA